MKPTEAKNWIDEAVSLGANRTKATELLDAYTTQLGPILSPITLAATIALLRSMQPETKPAEPESVEIPRRVVIVNAPDRVWYRERVGTVHDIRGIGSTCGTESGHAVVCDDDRAIRPGDFIELRLTKTEQARLLLEKLSREAWESVGWTPEGRGVYYRVNRMGLVVWVGSFGASCFEPNFPDKPSAEAARDTIIRAGLAWWEEGE